MSQENAVVTATYSRRMRLRLGDGRDVDARIKGKRLRPVCGDFVVAQPIANESDWLIVQISERRNALTRPTLRGGQEVLAANLGQLVVVAAAVPEPDWFIVDRYLCAAENMRIPAAAIYNKTDLDAGDDSVRAALSEYHGLGYPTLRISAKTGENFTDLDALLNGNTAIIVGQSGVGKSTIINRLVGEAARRTATVSAKGGAGRHTTVNSVMLELRGGGAVIDSPGVRDYAPALVSAAEAIRGYREVDAAGQGCRFANCRHLREPDCAVKAAVERGAISSRRYESYRRTLALTERLGG